MFIQGIIFDYENDLQSYHQRFIRTWGMINKIDRRPLGNKNSIRLEPYLIWAQSRAQNLMMPYHVVLPLFVEPITEGDIPHTVLHPDIPTDLEELHKSQIQLKEEMDTFETQFYASEKKVLELTKRLHKEQSLNAYVKTKRKCPWET